MGTQMKNLDSSLSFSHTSLSLENSKTDPDSITSLQPTSSILMQIPHLSPWLWNHLPLTRILVSSLVLQPTLHMYACVLSWFSCVRLFETPWTAACQAPLSMGFSRQEYWSGLPFPSPGHLLTQGSNPGLPHCRWILYHLSHQGSFLSFKNDFKEN